LYFEDVKQCSVSDDFFIEMLEDKTLKAIRVLSLDYIYKTREWVDWDSAIVATVDTEYTIRKEMRSNRAIWYAYRKVGGVLHKRYLGTSEAVTMTSLKEMAKKLPTGRMSS